MSKSHRGGWKETTLGEMLTFQRGFDITKSQMLSGQYDVIFSSGFGGTHHEFKVKAPGVVIGRKGTLGTVFFAKRNFWATDTTLWVKDFHGNDERFAYYFLQTLHLKQYDCGASNPTLNRNHIHQIEICYPNVHIQSKIAAILSNYDRLIENNTRRIEILEEMARSLYREWFVNFRFPGHEQVKLLGSELGLIPEGWEVKRVSEIANVYRGRSYRSVELVEEGGLPFLNLKCIERDGGFRHDGLKRYQGAYKDSQTARAGDIIMAVTDMTQERRIVARVGRVPRTDEDLFVFSMDLVKIAPKEVTINNYLYGMLSFSEFADQVKQYANGANVLHLNPSRIEEFKLAFPPKELSNKYAMFCSDISQQCDVLVLKNANLRRTRDLLLPKIISGEINVEKLNINLEEVEQ